MVQSLKCRVEKMGAQIMPEPTRFRHHGAKHHERSVQECAPLAEVAPTPCTSAGHNFDAMIVPDATWPERGNSPGMIPEFSVGACAPQSKGFQTAHVDSCRSRANNRVQGQGDESATEIISRSDLCVGCGMGPSARAEFAFGFAREPKRDCGTRSRRCVSIHHTLYQRLLWFRVRLS